jgi:DNA mismatch endonuclease (patch repair protein)
LPLRRPKRSEVQAQELPGAAGAARSYGTMRFDNVPESVRQRMSRTQGKGSRPEMLVRKLVHRMGFRFRLHRRDLPGTPDLVFPSRRKIIFVHGCFWHGHGSTKCDRGALPKTRIEYWAPKIARTRERDENAIRQLEDAGWEVLVLWECELGRGASSELAERLSEFLRA